jgi:hypothetical protein
MKSRSLAINDIPNDVLTSEMCLIAVKEDESIIDWVTDEVEAKIKRALNGEIF